MKSGPPSSLRNYAAGMEHLAGVLRSLREDAAFTQEQLAEKSGLSVRTVSDIERGIRKRLYRDTAERLARALGLPGPASEEFVELARGRTSGMRRELDSGFRRRFVAWHVDRIGALADHAGNEEQWFAVLDADESNLAVALRWASEDEDAESLLLLATGLFRYWQARGNLRVGREWLERGLSAAPAVSTPTRMAALWGLGWLAFHQGDDALASRCAQELTALADESGDGAARRNAATVSGMVSLANGDSQAAVESMERALSLARELGEPWILATSLLNLGMARIAAADTSAARAVLGEAIREYAALGDERFRARSLGYLGLASLVDGDPERAVSLYAQGLVVFHGLSEGKGIAESLTGLATAAAMRGNAIRAAQLAGAAERIRESFGGRVFPVERRLADATLARAEAETGAHAWHEAWTCGRALRDDEAIAMALDDPLSAR